MFFAALLINSFTKTMEMFKIKSLRSLHYTVYYDRHESFIGHKLKCLVILNSNRRVLLERIKRLYIASIFFIFIENQCQ